MNHQDSGMAITTETEDISSAPLHLYQCRWQGMGLPHNRNLEQIIVGEGYNPISKR